MLAFLVSAIRLGMTFLLGSTGEILTEKSGHLNLGIPGIMYVGAISGVVGSFLYENACGNAVENMVPLLAILIPLLCAILGSVIMGLIYSFLTVTLHANQNVTGLALTTLGIGLGNFLGASLITITKSDLPNITLTKTSSFFSAKLPFAENLGWFGRLFLNYDFLTYAAIAIALIVAFVLNRTRVGLNLRAVGENPATADAAGINVTAYKYVAILIGSGIAGLGGFYYIMDYIKGSWENAGIIEAFGWLAIALVIFVLWKPHLGILGAFLFGGCYIVAFVLANVTSTQKEIIKMLPYVITIVVLIVTSIFDNKENQPPASLGLPYFREDR